MGKNAGVEHHTLLAGLWHSASDAEVPLQRDPCDTHTYTYMVKNNFLLLMTLTQYYEIKEFMLKIHNLYLQLDLSFPL